MLSLQLVETLRSQHKKGLSHAECHKALNFAIQAFRTWRVLNENICFWQTVLSKYDKIFETEKCVPCWIRTSDLAILGLKLSQLS